MLLDVSVPMYAAGQPHPHKEACAWVMTQVAAERLHVAIDTETIQEVLYRYGALRRWDIATAMASDLLDLIPTVYAVWPADVRNAIALFKQYAPAGVTARDVIHVAVMQNNGLSEIISTDEHFDRVAAIRRLDPEALLARARR